MPSMSTALHKSLETQDESPVLGLSSGCLWGAGSPAGDPEGSWSEPHPQDGGLRL